MANAIAEGIKPQRILSPTFTNRACAGCAESERARPEFADWLDQTFHGLCASMLRAAKYRSTLRFRHYDEIALNHQGVSRWHRSLTSSHVLRIPVAGGQPEILLGASKAKADAPLELCRIMVA